MRKLLAAALFTGALTGASLSVPAQAQTAPSAQKVKTKKVKTKLKPDHPAARLEDRKPGGAGGRGNRLAELTKDLHLTADQQTRVQAIQQEQMQQMQTMREQASASGDRQAMMTQMRSLDEGTDTKLKAVLTPEQFQRYQATKQERMPNRRPQGSNQ
jgi:Spy/CpxP family protein refolding chaperone